MTVEERFIEAIEDVDEEEEIGISDRRTIRHEQLAGKNKTATDRFIGKKKRVYETGIVPRYYGELLAWALQRYLEKEGWQVVRILGYHSREPGHIDVDTGGNQRENLLRDGQLLIQKDKNRLVITVDINLRWHNSILVEGPVSMKEQVQSFVTGVMTLMQEQNFYRGQKIEFAGRLRFLDLNDRSWDSIILGTDIKREIRANTLDFLKKTRLWAKLGIPSKRGILLAGEPGTGKTIICKALMAEAKDMTCIITSAYALSDDDYITELYELAQDLAPCLVFIEDIDLIGQNREEFGYQKGPAMLSLLAVLDGIEEKKEIVTIATTNCLETLDKALSQRPSRFDRVIKLTRPGTEQRRELIDRLCDKIPLDKPTRDYITAHSEGYTPAQLQEIIFSLAIEHGESGAWDRPIAISADVIDRLISRINGKDKTGLGFRICNNGHNIAPMLANNKANRQQGGLKP